MKPLFFLYVWLNLTRIAGLRKENLVKHIRKRTIQTGRLFFSSSLKFKQHLLSLTQGTNNREAEKPTITGFVKEPLYASLCAMTYVINIIAPESTFKKNLLTLINTCPKGQLKEMGFPQNWQQENFWQL